MPTNQPPSPPNGRRGRRITAFTLVAGVLAALSSGVAADDPERTLEATSPLRYWDSRSAEDGGKIGPDGRLGVLIAGAGELDVFPEGADPVPADAVAAFVNVTAVEADAPGFVSVVPASDEILLTDAVPTTSNLNIDAAGQTIANSAIIPLGEGGGIPGQVAVYTSMGTHVLVDVLGYVPAGADYVSIDLERALDTRPTGGTDPEQRFDVDVVADFGPPDASLAIVNLTLIGSDGAGFVTAWPTGADQPDTSNLNVDGTGQTRAGLAIVPIGDDDSISVVSSTGGDLLVDVLGYFGSTSGFNGLEPALRAFDSRPDRVEADTTTQVEVADGSRVPTTAEFALVNVTAVNAADAGFVSVWPSGSDQPDSSNLNHTAGGTIANTVLVPLGVDGSIDVYNDAEIDLLVDVIGWL
ncbi:MAG: hypothetical protein WD225_10100 [Ilumatobacteraceae bacterium]